MTRLVAGALLLVLVGAPSRTSANDGAASVSAGGIVLRDEHRVAMRKERLFISQSKVEVEYEFFNESTEDVLTEVAFPLPDQGHESVSPQLATFDDFKVWVDDKPVKVAREITAVLDGLDVTAKLAALGVKDFLKPLRDRDLVTSELHERLADAGLAPKGYSPAWELRVLFHWSQRFPSHRMVKVRHAYRPVKGSSNSYYPEEYKRACVEPGLEAALDQRMAAWWARDQNREYRPGPGTAYVAYILTTAKTWKMPIREFELVVERNEGDLVSFCWDGPLKKVGPRTFKSVLKDFVPSKDLTVYFFSAAPLDSAKPRSVREAP